MPGWRDPSERKPSRASAPRGRQEFALGLGFARVAQHHTAPRLTDKSYRGAAASYGYPLSRARPVRRTQTRRAVAFNGVGAARRARPKDALLRALMALRGAEMRHRYRRALRTSPQLGWRLGEKSAQRLGDANGLATVFRGEVPDTRELDSLRVR